jgi:hypothetical protein
VTKLLALLAALAATTACKKKDEFGVLQATATVSGPAVVVTATCTDFHAIDAEGVSAECADGKVRLEVPADKLGAAPHTLHVRSSDENGKTISLVDLTVDTSLAGQPPYFRVASCDNGSADRATTGATIKVGDRTGGCTILDDARANLTIEANPGAKLTLGGATIVVPDTGRLVHPVDLVEQVLAVPLEHAVAATKTPTTFTVPYAVEAGGKKLDGTIELVELAGYEGSAARKLLASLGEGKAAAVRAAFTGRIAGWLDHDGKLAVTSPTGAVRDLGVIAVEHETARTESGTCDYKDVDGKHITAKRMLVDIEVVATKLADGSVLAKKAFPSSPDPRNCPMFEVMEVKDPRALARVPAELVTGWLASLAGE